MRLSTGIIIKTNYSDRHHKIVSIKRDCKCARLTDELGYTNSGMEESSPEHIHIACKDLEDNMNSWFNGYIENENDSIKSIWNPESEIIIVTIPMNLQLELF